MGSPVRISFYAAGEESARAAAVEAFAAVADVDRTMNDYDPESELSRLSGVAPGTPVRLSGGLLEVLRRSSEMSEASEGAFDVTAGPVIRLWRAARREGRLPDEAALRAALARSGYRALAIHGESGTVTLLHRDMQLDLGGIAKGFAADRAIESLRRSGHAAALVACAGDIAIGDPPPGRRGWTVEIPTGEHLELSRCGISTSGDTEQFVEIDGRRYSHIIDPRTGRAVERMETVTVLAPAGIVADPAATAIAVLGAGEGLDFARRLGVEVLIRERRNGRIAVTRSGGFPAAAAAQP